MIVYIALTPLCLWTCRRRIACSPSPPWPAWCSSAYSTPAWRPLSLASFSSRWIASSTPATACSMKRKEGRPLVYSKEISSLGRGLPCLVRFFFFFFFAYLIFAFKCHFIETQTVTKRFVFLVAWPKIHSSRCCFNFPYNRFGVILSDSE